MPESTRLSWWRRLLAVIAALAAGVVLVHGCVGVVLRTPLHGILSGNILLISVTERESGDVRTFPINYRRDGEVILCGSDRSWWKDLEGGADVELLLRGQRVFGYALPMVGDLERRSERLRYLRPYTWWFPWYNGVTVIEITRLAAAEVN